VNAAPACWCAGHNVIDYIDGKPKQVAQPVDGVFEVRPMSEFETSMKVLLRLARKQRQRVPVPPGRAETFAPARVH